MLDVVGYAAATTHRGIRLIRIPTTILAQNDAGIGIKNSINAFGVKNFMGTFTPPHAVLNDINFVSTLSARDKISGIAEAVKVALIRDANFFQWLEENATQLRQGKIDTLAYMIKHCAKLHLHHISTCGDPFEFTSALPLDFGHWAAHKLESLSQHDLRHGEAVAIGMALDSYYSYKTGLLSQRSEQRIYQLLEKLGFNLWHPVLIQHSEALIEGLEEFRAHLGSQLSVTLLSDIGSEITVHNMDHNIIRTITTCLETRANR